MEREVKNPDSLVTTHEPEDVHPLSNCAKNNLKKYNDLSKLTLEKVVTLPCECEQTTLKSLLNSYECTACKTKYLYSFCLDEVVSEESTWHCEICGSC